MYKRLTISLVLMGLAAFSLAAGAVAWFSDEGRANVTISAGSANLQFSVDLNCDGSVEAANQEYGPGNAATFNTWQDIVPGDTTEDCIEIFNVGDGDLDVFVHHENFSGNSDFLDAVVFRYQVGTGGGSFANLCPPAPGWANADGGRFTSGQGCEIGTIEEGDSRVIRVQAEFLDQGDQDGLENASFGFRSIVTGYTG